MSSTKSQVAVATNIPTLSSTQSQKDFSTEEHLGRQNSFGNNRRGNMKGKHLTRSHAMRESTSPPRTPTPRADAQLSPNGMTQSYHQQHGHHQQHIDGNENAANSHLNNNNNNNTSNNNINKLHAQSTAVRGNSPMMETPAVIITSQHNSQQQQQQQQQSPNVALSNEAEFPKLTPPKSKSGSNGGSGAGSQRHNNNNNNNPSNNCNNHSSNSNSSAEGNNNSNNGKKLVDVKTNGANVGTHETHKNNPNNSNNVNNGNNSKTHQQYNSSSSNNSSNVLHQAINTVESTFQPRGHQTAPTIYNNSGMNYQLNAPDNNSSPQPHQQQHQQQQVTFDKENRSARNDSQNSNISNMHDDEQHYEQRLMSGGPNNRDNGGGGGGKKHRANSKGSKPRLKNMGGSSGSVEGNSNSNNTSGFISRVFNNSENSVDQFTDHGGTDLLSFFKETLNKNLKDRHILLKIEKELIDFVQDKSRSELRFPSASSYNRMLIHRAAAFFGMEHNVDAETQQCVIVAITKNTRIPEIRFKSLLREIRDDGRKSILKRDTHSFDEARQSSYLCPDRGGMLDRKAKSFEEREEDYERARSRIFNRSQNDSCGDSIEDSYMNWPNPGDQQQQQQQNRPRPNGKILKMQNSTESRDGRTAGGAIPKGHSFSNYGGPPTNPGVALMRGESNNSNKSNSARGYAKQDSAGSTNTPWRLSPSSSGSIYHFDPSNMPSNQAIAAGVYHPNQSSLSPNAVNYSANHHQPQLNNKKNKQNLQQQPQQQYSNKPMQNEINVTNSIENVSESSTQTMALNADVNFDEKPKNSINNENCVYNEQGGSKEEAATQSGGGDECDNIETNCLSITTTSTKNYDRIEVQKFKNQATSPNIPLEKDEVAKRESLSSVESSNPRDQQLIRSQPSTNHTPNSSSQQNRDTPHSTSSTPLNTNNDSNAKRSSEEPKATTWTYTQSYQAPDGSTVFHTTTTPNSSQYCATTYQQGPDGSVYAIPQSMVYAYPPQVEGEMQGYFMPVFDPNQPRNDAPGLIPAGAQAIYPAAGGTATMVPVAAAYPTAQFATTNGTPLYPGQVIYSSEQFPPNGTAVATAAPPANGQLQQIPMTTYPIGYPYPYNGYWGQTMTYYVPQQTLTNAVTAAPLISAPPPQPPPPPSATVAGSHVAGGVNVSNGLIAATPAAGPSSNAASGASSNNNSSGAGSNNHAPSNGTTSVGSYQTHNGTTYFGTGRVKRPQPPHYNGPQNSQQIMAALPSTGGTPTTYHAVPALALAPAPPNAAVPNDLNPTAAPPTATMYALPQHATLIPANVFPYAPTATAGAPPAGSQPHVTGGALVQTTAAHSAVSNGPAHAPHSNAVITSFYAHHPQLSGHAPGPAAIPIVDPSMVNTQISAHLPVSSNGIPLHSGGASSNTSQSAPSTPHSLPSQAVLRGNPPLFPTPPIINHNINGGNGTYSSSSTPNYYTTGDLQNNTRISNSPRTSYTPSYDKRNNNNNNQNAGGKKPPTYPGGAVNRQNTNNYNSKPPLISSNNDTRTSPNNNGSNNYHGPRQHAGNKRGNEKPQTPLLSGPPNFSGASASTINYNTNANAHGTSSETVIGKPPVRLNAAAASFRQKPSGIEYRRSVSQRNSPGTNSSSNDNSNNNSPNSIAGVSATLTPITNCYTPAYLTNNIVSGHGGEQQPTPATAPHSIYIAARGTHIPPPQMQHGGTITAAGGTVATVAATNAAAEAANAAAAAAAATVAHHQPLIGAYNPGASGVYFKYGQTYFAHPTVALPNSRRSPSTDMRPPMAQMAGIYPTVNMMIPGGHFAPPRHGHGRHPNPNYKGTRPR